MVAYISALPFLLIALSAFSSKRIMLKIIQVYSIILICLISLLTIVDAELYSFWGFKVDATIFRYISTPKEMVASTLSSPLVLLVTLLLGLVVLSSLILDKIISSTSFAKSNFATFLITLCITIALAIPIRGGFQLTPVNESAVYFSSYNLANQTAVNIFWNFMHSILEKSYETNNPFVFLEGDKAATTINELYKMPSDNKVRLVKGEKPNVIFIIWESFTSKALDTFQGKVVTPNFYDLKKEGIYFNNIYASGDRSEKGLVAILSGYPAQPITSIINNPAKSAKLPAISNVLSNQGYNTSFIYGGELEFANIKSYLLNKNFQTVIGIDSFPKEHHNSKWGAHDEYVLDKTLNFVSKSKPPFFSSVFTLSSHEPFEVPIKPLLNGNEKDILFLNSHHYTDKCIGDFIAKAKRTKWWDNTLIVIISDHGHPLPGGNFAAHGPEEFKIPMLWLGGALNKRDTIIEEIGSQTDLAATLLGQMNIGKEEFKFSRDLSIPSEKPFAYYSFNNGFGFITKDKVFVHDNVSKSVIFSHGEIKEDDLTLGRSYLQFSFQDYVNK